MFYMDPDQSRFPPLNPRELLRTSPQHHAAVHQEESSLVSGERSLQNRKRIDEDEFEKLKSDIQDGSIHPSLVLEGRDLDDEQFIGILERMSNSDKCRISGIFFSKNAINSEAIQRCIPWFQKNTTLTTIDLPHNKLDERVVGFFLAIFEKNFTIIQLNLYYNSILNDGQNKIQAKILRNVQLRKEINKKDYYVEFIRALMKAQIPLDIILIHLEYYIGVSYAEAREYIATNLYQPAIMEAQSSAGEIKASDNTVSGVVLSPRITEVQNPVATEAGLDFAHTASPDTNQQGTALIFSELKNKKQNSDFTSTQLKTKKRYWCTML